MMTNRHAGKLFDITRRVDEIERFFCGGRITYVTIPDPGENKIRRIPVCGRDLYDVVRFH